MEDKKDKEVKQLKTLFHEKSVQINAPKGKPNPPRIDDDD